MSPAKKKPAVTVAVGIGKPKPDPLGAPDSLDGPPPKPELAPDEGEGEYSSDLLGDMVRPLVNAGLSDADAKTMLAEVFRAGLKCLERGGKEEQPPTEEGTPAEDNPYGR